MKQNKGMKGFNRTILTTGAIGAIIIPLCLSSCSTISQYNLPVNITVDYNFPDIVGNAFEDQIYPELTSNNHYYYNSHAYNPTSIPNKYILHNDTSAGLQTYFYDTPENESDYDKYVPPAAGTSTPPQKFYDASWLQSSSDKLKFSETVNTVGSQDDESKVVALTSAHNLYDSAFNTINSGIAEVQQAYLTAVISFFTQSDILFSQDKLNNAFKDFFSNSGVSITNKKLFAEFCLDYANLLGTGKKPFKFAYGDTNISYVDCPSFGLDAGDKFGVSTTKTINDVYDSTNNWINTGATNNVLPKLFNYPSFMADKPTDPGTDILHIGGSFVYPFFINTAPPTAPSATFRYYNPLNNHGFQQTDYLTKDKKGLADTMAKEWNDTWKKWVGNDVDLPSEQDVQLAWQYKGGSNFSYTPPVTPISAQAVYDRLSTDDKGKAKYIDDTVISQLNQQLYNSYIAFGVYSFLPCLKSTATYDPTNKTFADATFSNYTFIPMLNGIYTLEDGTPAIYPTSLLLDSSNWQTSDTAPVISADAIDTSLFTDSLLPEANYLSNSYADKDSKLLIDNIKNDVKGFQDKKENRVFRLDPAKIATKQKNVFKYLQSRTTTDFEHSNDYHVLAANVVKAIFSLWDSSSPTQTVRSDLNFEDLFAPLG